MNLVRDRWMFVPIVLLGGSVGIASITVGLAVAGRPVGVEPDYYEKAIHWDESRAQSSRNDRLGWTVSPELVPGATGMPHLILAVTDKHGVPVPASGIDVEAIPVRNAELRTPVPLSQTSAGRFEGDIPLRISGQWEFRVTVHSGEETYTDSFRRTLSFTRRTPGDVPTGVSAP